jgi:hypothetical protein
MHSVIAVFSARHFARLLRLRTSQLVANVSLDRAHSSADCQIVLGQPSSMRDAVALSRDLEGLGIVRK